eukprot:gb/GFBE01000262.1/.p1 GENE.gb/GFBE01000262.1/~~gb/GFBE01000262.1/.p1  ORF type:complete len:516 (+),score=96.40 gb/GFBE01000262.1/:1-1548(+)
MLFSVGQFGREKSLREVETCLRFAADDAPGGTQPRLWQDLVKPLPNEAVQGPIVRLQHMHLRLQELLGKNRQEATALFQSTVWKELKDEAKRHWKAGKEQYDEYIAGIRQDWLARAREVLQGRLLPGEPLVRRPGPAPLPADDSAQAGPAQVPRCPLPSCTLVLPSDEVAMAVSCLETAAERDVARLTLSGLQQQVRQQANPVLEGSASDDVIEAALRNMSSHLLAWERAEAQLSVWKESQASRRNIPLTSSSHLLSDVSSSSKKDALDAFQDDAFAARLFFAELKDFELNAEAMSAQLASDPAASADIAQVQLHARLHLAKLIGKVAGHLKGLSSSTSHAASQRKHHRMSQDKKKSGVSSVVRGNPNTVWLSFEESVNRLTEVKDTGAVFFPWSHGELVEVGRLLDETTPVMSLSTLLRLVPPSHVNSRAVLAEQCAEQLCEYLPILTLSSILKVEVAKHVMVLWLPDPSTLPHCLSMLAGSALDFDVLLTEGDDGDAGDSEDSGAQFPTWLKS